MNRLMRTHLTQQCDSLIIGLKVYYIGIIKALIDNGIECKRKTTYTPCHTEEQ